jgi:hypothetical protein
VAQLEDGLELAVELAGLREVVGEGDGRVGRLDLADGAAELGAAGLLGLGAGVGDAELVEVVLEAELRQRGSRRRRRGRGSRRAS